MMKNMGLDANLAGPEQDRVGMAEVTANTTLPVGATPSFSNDQSRRVERVA